MGNAMTEPNRPDNTLQPVSRPLPLGQVEGWVAPGMEPLLDCFVDNFTSCGEVGASLCVMRHGEVLVDLWGGLAEPDTSRPWQQDTVSIVFSNTKPATAMCLHILADRGLVDLDAPVTEYWPEYAAAGKAATTVRMLLDHSAGVPALRARLPDGAAFDWDTMTERLAAEAPFWMPGTRVGYHGLTFGWLVGEVVRRVSGRSLGTFFREAVADPLGIDFWIGLPEAMEPRVAPIIPYVPAGQTPLSAFERSIAEEPDSITALYFKNTGGWRPSGFNSRRGRAAELGATNGVTNARGLAGFYAPLACGGTWKGRRVISPARIAEFSRVTSASHDDATLRIPSRFAAGFMVRMDNRARGLDSVIIPDGAFGHVGAGGSIGFADPHTGIAFGYTMNRMGRGLLLNDRGQNLIGRLYDTVLD